MWTRRPRGSFELPMSASEAIHYFTPEGERPWAPGWDPQYPIGEASEEPGTVFLTSHGDVETIWVIDHIDREACTAAYARVTPGQMAGTVRVSCSDTPEGGCVVSVEYDMTLLATDHPELLDGFGDAAYAAMMEEWKRLVSAGLPGSGVA